MDIATQLNIYCAKCLALKFFCLQPAETKIFLLQTFSHKYFQP